MNHLWRSTGRSWWRLTQIFDRSWGQLFFRIEPDNPSVAGELKVFIAGSRETFSRGLFHPCPEIVGNLDRIIGAPFIEDNPLCEGVDLTQTAGKISGLVEAEGADGDGKTVGHHRAKG